MLDPQPHNIIIPLERNSDLQMAQEFVNQWYRKRNTKDSRIK